MRVKLLLPVHARNKVDEGSWMPDEEGRGRTLAAKTLQGEAAEAFKGEYDGDDKLVANLASWDWPHYFPVHQEDSNTEARNLWAAKACTNQAQRVKKPALTKRKGVARILNRTLAGACHSRKNRSHFVDLFTIPLRRRDKRNIWHARINITKENLATM